MNCAKRFLPMLGGLVAYFSSSIASSAPVLKGTAPPPPFSPDQVLVAFHPGASSAARAHAHSAAGAVLTETLGAIGVEVVTVPAGTVLDRVALYKRSPNVKFAEPNYLRPLILPQEGQDPPWPAGLGIDYLSEQWGLNNTGQLLVDPDTGIVNAYKGTTDADIDAPEGWDVSTGNSTIKIAILDTGVECTHADLNGKCVESVNFSASPTSDDIIGHGTHVAGIAAANTNNNVGVAGVGWNSSIGSLKVCHEQDIGFGYLVGVCSTVASANAITWAADHGYHVINMSYGSDPDPYTPSLTEQNAVDYAWSQGVVLVAAAGNDYSLDKVYPAAFPNVIAVAASDRHDNLASFSTFGSWVGVAAPGHNIFSALPNSFCGLPLNDTEGCYGWLSGTSMAAPHVAGLAALVKAHTGGDASSVRSLIEGTADKNGALGQNFLAWTQHGRINVHRALTGNAPPPSSISLTAAGYKVKGLQKANLTWSGAVSSSVDIYRDGIIIATSSNTGSYTDNINQKGAGSYAYKVCEVGGLPCSNAVIVTF